MAIDDTNFQHFLKQLQRRFPQEKAETMLSNLGIDRANERQLYYSDEEYAAAVIGLDLSNHLDQIDSAPQNDHENPDNS